jgi:Fibronectin type III domain
VYFRRLSGERHEGFDIPFRIRQHIANSCIFPCADSCLDSTPRASGREVFHSSPYFEELFAVKKQFALPLAAILIATPAWARQNARSSLSLSTTALSFNGSSGNVSSQPFTVTVTGPSPVTVTNVSISNGTFFAPAVSLPVTLSSGQSITGQISARPQSTAQTGTATIVSSVGTYTVSLSETATAKPSTSYSVDLAWNAPSKSTDPVDSYQVDRAVSGSTQYSTVGTTTAASMTFTDTSVTAGQTYVYQVRSVDESGNTSTPSNTLTLAIP